MFTCTSVSGWEGRVFTCTSISGWEGNVFTCMSLAGRVGCLLLSLGRVFTCRSVNPSGWGGRVAGGILAISNTTSSKASSSSSVSSRFALGPSFAASLSSTVWLRNKHTGIEQSGSGTNTQA